MKNRYLTTTIAMLFVAIASIAQPISGYMGKRFATSLELEIVPGFQKSYEKHTSDFLSPGIFENAFSYVPRFLLSTEYQVKTTLSMHGSIGLANMNVPIFLRPQSNSFYTPNTETIQRLQTTFIQMGIRSCSEHKQMPMASTYYGFGVGIYFISMDAFEAEAKTTDGPPELMQFDKTSAINVAANIEFGRRIVFNKGFFMDFGTVVNLSPSLLINFNPDTLFDEVVPIEDSIKGRVATNSLFNFKIAFGLFY